MGGHRGIWFETQAVTSKPVKLCPFQYHAIALLYKYYKVLVSTLIKVYAY